MLSIETFWVTVLVVVKSEKTRCPDHVSLSSRVTLAACHVTGRLTCLADSLA
jgi:hypothetical protein